MIAGTHTPFILYS